MENPYELVRTSYRESSKVYRSDMFLPDRGLGADDATNLQVLPSFPQMVSYSHPSIILEVRNLAGTR